MLLAVTPLPKPLTTPPDTSTYFMLRVLRWTAAVHDCLAICTAPNKGSAEAAPLWRLLQAAGSQSTAALRLNLGDDRIPTAIAFRSSALPETATDCSSCRDTSAIFLVQRSTTTRDRCLGDLCLFER